MIDFSSLRCMASPNMTILSKPKLMPNPMPKSDLDLLWYQRLQFDSGVTDYDNDSEYDNDYDSAYDYDYDHYSNYSYDSDYDYDYDHYSDYSYDSDYGYDMIIICVIWSQLSNALSFFSSTPISSHTQLYYVGRLIAPGVISCKPPRLAESGAYDVTVALNGETLVCA